MTGPSGKTLEARIVDISAGGLCFCVKKLKIVDAACQCYGVCRNAIVLPDVYTRMVPMSMDSQLEKIRYLFAPYLAD